MHASAGAASPRDAARILRERARALAQVDAPAPPAGSLLDLLEFELGRERYAIETRYVREVCALRNLAPLPCVPRFVLGIVGVRGRILPVIDIRIRFDLPGQGLTDLNRVVVAADGEVELGLLVDAIRGVRQIPAETLQGPLPTLGGVRAEYLKGVTAEHLVVLDLRRMLADPAMVVHEEVEG